MKNENRVELVSVGSGTIPLVAALLLSGSILKADMIRTLFRFRYWSELNTEYCFYVYISFEILYKKSILFKLNFNSLKSVPGQVWTELKVL